MNSKKQHGGQRPGAGRPPKYDASVVSVLLKLPGDLARKLAAKCERLGITRTAAIQEAIKRWVGRS